MHIKKLLEGFLLFLLLCHEVWPLFRKWGRERVFVCSKARDLYCIQYLSFLQLPLAAVLPVPVVISSISDLGADPKRQIYGKIFPSLSSSLHIYLFKCRLAERSGSTCTSISKGFAEFTEFRQAGGKRGVGKCKEKV